MPKKPSTAFYAVKAGRQTGVFLTWLEYFRFVRISTLKYMSRAECEEQIKGFTGARYKKFSNAAEAEAFVTRALVAGASPTDPSVGTSDSKGKKRAVPAELEDESRFDIVYSDGACKGNGKAGSIAGIGVWWGRNDPR